MRKVFCVVSKVSTMRPKRFAESQMSLYHKTLRSNNSTAGETYLKHFAGSCGLT